MAKSLSLKQKILKARKEIGAIKKELNRLDTELEKGTLNRNEVCEGLAEIRMHVIEIPDHDI
jgi:hypothetical protein